MILTKEVTMNLNYRGAPVVMDALQGDSGRVLIAHLFAGEDAWSVPEDTSVVMHYECADGTGGMYDTLPDGSPAYILQAGGVAISLIPALFAMPGCTKLQITFLRGDVQISTFAMDIQVYGQVNAPAAATEYINLAAWLNAHKKGDTGDSGVYLGEKEPEDPLVRVWIDPEGEASVAYFGMPYSSAEKAININGDGSVTMYLFAGNDGYDAVVSGTGAIADGDVTTNKYMDIEADNRPHKDYIGKIKRLHIESGITSIGDNFMLGAYRLEKLSFGNSTAITHLGAYVFAVTSVDGEYDFSGLEDETLHSAFLSCSKLKGVTLSKAVETIGVKSFYKCYSLQYVRGLSSVTTVEEAAFYDCHSLADVDLNPAQVSLGEYAFAHIATLAKITGTDTLLFNAEWDSGSDCFTQKDWGENLDAVRNTKGESVTLPLPVFDSQCEPFYRDWKIIWVDLPYDPETGKDLEIQRGSVRSGGCGLLSYYHIYNSLHPDAQYPNFKDFAEHLIFANEIEVTQELHDWLNASEVGRALMEKNTAVSYAVGSKINAFDLPHALYYGDDVGNEQDGAIFWGFLQACQFEGTTVYASDFENGVSNMKKAMIEALHAGKPIKLSRHSHAVSVFGYDKDSNKFLIYDSTSLLPAAEYANVYWGDLEAFTAPTSAYGACQIITEEKITMNDMDKKLDDILQSVRVRVVTGSFTPTEDKKSLHLDMPNGVKLLEIKPEVKPTPTSQNKAVIIYLIASEALKNETKAHAGNGVCFEMSPLRTEEDGSYKIFTSYCSFDNTNGFDVTETALGGAAYFPAGTTYNWTAYYWD